MSDSPPERILVDQTRQELLLTLWDLAELQGRLDRLPDVGLGVAGPGAEGGR